MKKLFLFLLLLLPPLVSATTLIPTGAIDSNLNDLIDTAFDIFNLIVPVVVSIIGLKIAIHIIRRFLNKTVYAYPEDDELYCPHCLERIYWNDEGYCPECGEQMEDGPLDANNPDHYDN